MQNLPFDPESKAGFVFLLEGAPLTAPSLVMDSDHRQVRNGERRK
jgi:hypothetical protein